MSNKLYAVFINTNYEFDHIKNLSMITQSEEKAKEFCDRYYNITSEDGGILFQWASYRAYELDEEIEIDELFQWADDYNDITHVM